MEYYLPIKRNKLLTYVTTWTNLGNVLNKIYHSSKTTYCRISFIRNVQYSLSLYNRTKLMIL